MLAPQLHFSREEFAARLRRLGEEMERRKLDACLLFRQESMYYLTGYDTFGYVFFQCLALRRDGRMTLLTRAPDLRQAQLTSTITDIRIWQDRHGASPVDELREIVREGGGKRLGVEWDAYGLSAKNGKLLADAFADYQLSDFSDVISGLRVVKSAAEIDYIRRAAALTDDALDAAIAETRAGADEGDILAAMQAAVFRGGGEYPGNEFILGSGQHALLCRSHAGRRRLAAADQLTLEYAGVYRRYHAAAMQTLIVGEPSARAREMHRVAEAAFYAAKDALRPGAPIGEVFDAYAKTADDAGMKAHRLNATGYSMGAVFLPTWMDYPMFYHGNPFVAAENMVFFLHIILMDSDSETAMTTGETLLVTAAGAEGLSRHSRELICR